MIKTNTKIEWPLVGNKQITDYLTKSIEKKQIIGTYIFNGPDNLGKTTLANHFAKIILCKNYHQADGKIPCGECPSCTSFSREKKSSGIEGNESLSLHGDYHIIKKNKDKKNISVEETREFIRALGMSSFLGKYKIGVIKHADTLSQEAANALLKTLEEPKENVVVILVAKSLESLPETIVSRSQVLYFRPVKADEIYDFLIAKHGAPRSAAKNYSRLCLGRPALAVKFFEDKEFFEKYSNHAKLFINFFSEDINSRLLSIEELIGKKATGQEAVIIARRILDVWSGILRDWLLYEFGHSNIVQHQIYLENIASLKSNTSIKKILNIAKTIKDGKEYLQNNVNPKLVLENIAVSI